MIDRAAIRSVTPPLQAKTASMPFQTEIVFDLDGSGTALTFRPTLDGLLKFRELTGLDASNLPTSINAASIVPTLMWCLAVTSGHPELSRVAVEKCLSNPGIQFKLLAAMTAAGVQTHGIN